MCKAKKRLKITGLFKLILGGILLLSCLGFIGCSSISSNKVTLYSQSLIDDLENPVQAHETVSIQDPVSIIPIGNQKLTISGKIKYDGVGSVKLGIRDTETGSSVYESYTENTLTHFYFTVSSYQLSEGFSDTLVFFIETYAKISGKRSVIIEDLSITQMQ